MDFRKYPITRDDNDRRADRVARRFLPDLPLSGIYKLMRKGLVRVDGHKINPDFRVSEGSELFIADVLSEPGRTVIPETQVVPKKQNSLNDSLFTPDIILETDDLIFLNKPYGISVHGENGLDQLVPQSASAQGSLSFRTGPLHRLDRDTTGLIAFSRSLAGARWFSDGIKNHSFEKYYLGFAEGILADDAEWQDTDEAGNVMTTLVHPLALSGSDGIAISLVRYRIITGKKHQIRIQTSLHGHPLCGDARYGGKPARGVFRFSRYFLHAWQLRFPSERLQGLPESVVAPIPADFAALTKALFGEYVLAHIERAELYWNSR
jgi:23S rRNA pseudouridine955/2504/2580 synthase